MSAPATRPEGVRFWTGTDVAEWIEAHVKYDKVASGNEQLAVWWFAVQNARIISEDYTLREIAEMLVDGVKAYDMDDVTEEVRARHGYESGEPDVDHVQVDKDIEDDLLNFFADGRW